MYEKFTSGHPIARPDVPDALPEALPDAKPDVKPDIADPDDSDDNDDAVEADKYGVEVDVNASFDAGIVMDLLDVVKVDARDEDVVAASSADVDGAPDAAVPVAFDDRCDPDSDLFLSTVRGWCSEFAHTLSALRWWDAVKDRPLGQDGKLSIVVYDEPVESGAGAGDPCPTRPLYT